MRRIYIAHPLRGGTRDPDTVRANEESITEIMLTLTEFDPDLFLFSPIHAFGYLDPLGPQGWVLSQCLEMVAVCDELWAFGDWRGSEGCRLEVARALELGKTVRFPKDVSEARLWVPDWPEPEEA